MAIVGAEVAFESSAEADDAEALLFVTEDDVGAEAEFDVVAEAADVGFGIWKLVANGSGGFSNAEIRGAGDAPWLASDPLSGLVFNGALVGVDNGKGIGTSELVSTPDRLSEVPPLVDLLPLKPNGDGNGDNVGFGSGKFGFNGARDTPFGPGKPGNPPGELNGNAPGNCGNMVDDVDGCESHPVEQPGNGSGAAGDPNGSGIGKPGAVAALAAASARFERNTRIERRGVNLSFAGSVEPPIGSSGSTDGGGKPAPIIGGIEKPIGGNAEPITGRPLPPPRVRKPFEPLEAFGVDGELAEEVGVCGMPS